ncbi:condensin-2 complex subunit G2 [Nephila pilipes]|uniref:Condensin-2 complex subunit G2 n=1 Tax=Nephila pilipes TaxID=299642 RepID=A0A8X6N3M5_NEPPI|nr:condensin-2 complex subunit G2 [Nephila pilipes]
MKGKDLLDAVNEIDSGTFLEFAAQNRSKKSPFAFKELLKDLKEDEIETMWEELSKIVILRMETVIGSCMKGSPNKTRESTTKKTCLEICRIVQAAIDLAAVMFQQSLPVSPGLLLMIVFLNRIISEIPSDLESLKNSIALICERMFSLNYLQQNDELITFNTVIYLMKRSLIQNKKKFVKRIYALRSVIPKIINMKEVNSDEVWTVYKQCATSPLYLSMLEGRKIISSFLTADIEHVSEIHKAIKGYLPSATVAQGIAYGKVYFDAWSISMKTKKETLKNELEIYCIQDLILFAVNGRQKSLILVMRKLLAQLHCQKKENHVSRMLYFLYRPILWRFLKNPDGLIRANTTQLFLDVFPLEDPDVKIITIDMELNEQMLMIKDLLLDDFPIVRSAAIIGLCIAMSINWELFPEDMLKTYFKIIVNDLSCDSSSVDVRCAVAKGFKVLLENPLTIPTLRIILPRLKPLFHDISDPVRIAFCQLLLRVKKICGIKYYEIVPLDHLLARMEEDPVVAKAIVNLIHNSYFPKNESAEMWLGRCVEMIKVDRGASRVFFQYVPNLIGLNATAQFMIQVVKAIHFYVKNKVMFKKTDNQSNKKNVNSISEEDIEVMEEAISLHDPEVVSGLIDATAIMWLSSLANLEKPENKNVLKMIVAKLSKYLGDLALYYKDTPVWQSVYYLSSFMPSRSIPSLASLCFLRLKTLDSSASPQDYMILLECLCNYNESSSLLILIKEWIEEGFLPSANKPPAKKRKSKKNSVDSEEKSSSKHILAVRMLTSILDHRSCQKAIIKRHSDTLKEFLNYLDDIKRKIELAHVKTPSDDDVIFIIKLLNILLQISVLLHTEGKLGSVKFVEDVIVWIQEKLFKHLCPDANLSQSLNTSRKQNLNASTSKKTPLKNKKSPEFEKLVLEICKDTCQIVTDMTLLGYMNRKSLKFLKFGLKMLNLECGGMLFLPVSKLFFNHVSYGLYLMLEEKEISILKFVPDCFNKFIQCLNEEIFLKSVPLSDAKEIQSLLAGSLLLMRPHAMLDELVKSITCTVTKNILSSILNSIENWDDIEKKCNPFEKIPISKSGAFLLTMMCMKPKIIVYFLQQLQKHLVNSAKDIKTWVACYVIVVNIWEMKNVSKNISKEIHCLVNKMEDLLLEHHPLKDIDTNLPLTQDTSTSGKQNEKELSFEEHCQYEYKKLKDLLLQKANVN